MFSSFLCTDGSEKERKKENPSLPQLFFFPCEKVALILALFVFGFSAALWGLVTTDWMESVRVVLGFCNSEVGMSLKLSFSLFLSLSLSMSLEGKSFRKV
jgi:hypothetical protein